MSHGCSYKKSTAKNGQSNTHIQSKSNPAYQTASMELNHISHGTTPLNIEGEYDHIDYIGVSPGGPPPVYEDIDDITTA